MPEGIAQHDERSAVRAVFIGSVEEAAEPGLNAHHIKVISRCLQAPGCNRSVACIESHLRNPISSQILKAAISLTQVEVVGIRLASILVAHPFDRIEALWLGDVERPQNEAVHDAKH